MIDLPLRDKIVECLIPDTGGVVLLMEPLADPELMEIMQTQGIREAIEGGKAEIAITVSLPLMLDMFPKKIRGARNFTVDGGKPFDYEDKAHLSAIPFNWKVAAVGDVVAYASQPPKDLEKNSKAPAEPSPTDTT